MDVNMEWNVCRICLQESDDMQTIFDDEDSNPTLSDKIMQCSSIIVEKGGNFPEQICNKCIDDLNVAYRFRTNCESSAAILNSILESTIVPAPPTPIPEMTVKVNTGELYKFRPPSDLKIVRKSRQINNEMLIIPKLEPEHDEEHIQESIIFIPSDDELVREQQQIDEEEMENIIEMSIPDPPPLTRIHLKQERDVKELYETIDDGVEFVTENSVNIQNFEEIYPNSDINAIDDNVEFEIMHVKPVLPKRGRIKTSTNVENVTGMEMLSQRLSGDGVTVLERGNDDKRVIRLKRTYNDPKPLKICEICGNSYKYQHALESHMRRHRNERPFKCNICGRGFVINFELSRHMRTHTGQKPYSCKFCDRKFSDFGSRIKHERTHTGERPYTCETCGKTFAYSHVLSSHNLIHTGVKNYQCTICHKKFAKAHHLKAHKITHERRVTKVIRADPSRLVTSLSTGDEEPPPLNERLYQDVMTILSASKRVKSEKDIANIQTSNSNQQFSINIKMEEGNEAAELIV